MTDSVFWRLGNFSIISANAIATTRKNKKLPNTIKQIILNKAVNSHKAI